MNEYHILLKLSTFKKKIQILLYLLKRIITLKTFFFTLLRIYPNYGSNINKINYILLSYLYKYWLLIYYNIFIII